MVRNNVKPENIVSYWKREAEENGENIIINTSWENVLNNCWACGINFRSLERCHIIPTILGGEMKVHNMVLMCCFCNKMNPETIYSDDFWRWVKGRVKYGFIDIRNIAMNYDLEYKMMYGYNFSELMYQCLENEKDKGEPHLKTISDSFSSSFFAYLKNNKNRYYTRYPATIAVAMNHYFPIWVEENFNENSEFVIKNRPIAVNIKGKIVVMPPPPPSVSSC